MQINRFVNGEKTESISSAKIKNKEIRDVIRSAEKRLETVEEKR